MSVLTGHKDIDLMILQTLTDKELGRICRVNKKVRNLCNEESFWIIRTVNEFPFLNGQDVKKMQKYLGFEHPKELYKYLISFPSEAYLDNVQIYQIDRNYVISLFKDEKILDEVINEVIDLNNLPKWINKDDFVYDIRRTFPERFLMRKTNKDKKLSLLFLIPQEREFRKILRKQENYNSAKNYDQFNF